MSNKISWLLLEYDKTHNKSGLVVSGVFSEDFVEWIIALQGGTQAAIVPAVAIVNNQSEAITLWKLAVACWENNGDMNDFYLGNEKRINAVVV
jgi:hypothetical protein